MSATEHTETEHVVLTDADVNLLGNAAHAMARECREAAANCTGYMADQFTESAATWTALAERLENAATLTYEWDES
jgi:hypothetical protein